MIAPAKSVVVLAAGGRDSHKLQVDAVAVSRGITTRRSSARKIVCRIITSCSEEGFASVRYHPRHSAEDAG